MKSRNSPHEPAQSAQVWHGITGAAALVAAAAIILLPAWSPDAIEMMSSQPGLPSALFNGGRAAGDTDNDLRRVRAERLAAEHDAFLHQAHGTANRLRPDEPFPLQFWP